MRRALSLACPLAFLCTTVLLAADAPDPPGLGDPGKLVSITLDSGRTIDGKFVLAGRDAHQQLLVTGTYDSGQVRDLSRDVVYTVAPEGIVTVDASGYVSPIAEGDVTVHVQLPDGPDSTVGASVTDIAVDLPVNFPNQVVPIFTKYGCNSGSCHGKSSGQNGFRLSLLGFVPNEDYEYLVKEGRGRRLFPSAPSRSLLLTKSVAQSPHGGGHRISIESPAYRLLHRWIEQGMPYGSPEDPTVTHIEVLPRERLMGREHSQQLVSIAHYTDGSTKDVSRMTQFDSNDAEMAEVSATGLVTTARLTGSVAVMARYQGYVGVFRATVPLGIPADNLPPTTTVVDTHVFAKLKDLGLPSSEVSGDQTFLRRVTVDIAGRLPSTEETEAFLLNSSPTKRAELVDRLLEGTDHAEYFANKWSAILRNKRRAEYEKTATFGFYDWIRSSILENKPYDEFVRQILTASGDAQANAPVAWYREVKDASAQVEDTAQLFLGLRIQCARCHHHPFEVWSQQDYYGFQAFFSRVGRKKGLLQNEVRIYHNPGVAQSQNPKTKQMVKPTGLGAPTLELSQYDDPRHGLADWMAAPDNPFFARALVNRYWKHFFGRGLVDPEDDMRVTNPATNPKLLDALAKDFIENKFDMKHLIRTICNSQTYQLAAEPNAWNQNDKQNFSRYYPKRLNAEVLLDAINQVTGTTTGFSGAPAGTRAVQLPDNGFTSYFLTVFGRPEASSACECERSSEANLAQSLHLLNSSEIQGKLTAGSGSAARLAADKDRDHATKIRELYLLAFVRPPLDDETAIAIAHIEKCGDDVKRAYEDIVWALINTKEFLFNH
ncbi:MAG: DUF1553 domain-containing protein [Pirellulaceae bacterium]|jgi:hypothetical protein|nr:DUF1553 domain-containing protein [Pirellulaceae bacterium]